LPDGAHRTYPNGTTGMGIAESIAKSLAKAAIAIKINGELSDLSLPITNDCSIALIKREDDDALGMIRHDCAHVLAEAVQNLYPNTQVTIGPNIENGFFYDFHRETPFTPDDLIKIESGKDYSTIPDKIYAIHCLKTNDIEIEIETLGGSKIIFPVGSFIKGAVYQMFIKKINSNEHNEFIGYTLFKNTLFKNM
jgi:hypothetical protein